LIVEVGSSEKPYIDEIQDCDNADLAFSGAVAFMNSSKLKFEQTLAGMQSPELYHPYSTSCENGQLHVLLTRDHCWEGPGDDPGVIRKACVVHIHAVAEEINEEGKVEALSGSAYYWVCHYYEGSSVPFECPLDCTANPADFTAVQP
jgi:hypothetical protein